MFRCKRFLSVLLIALLLLSGPAGPAAALSLPDLAIKGGKIKPQFLYISNYYTSLTITEYGEADVYGMIDGANGLTDQVVIYLYLQKYENGVWSNVQSWSQSFSGSSGSLTGYKVVPYGNQSYRAMGSYYVYTGGDFEHVYDYSSIVVY